MRSLPIQTAAWMRAARYSEAGAVHWAGSPPFAA